MENEYIKLKTADNFGRVYNYAERKGVDSIAFVLIDKSRTDGKIIGLIQEFKPPIQEFLITAFGGSLDKPNLNPFQHCMEEIEEEAGYKLNPSQVEFLGKYFVSTQMNQFCHLYVAQVRPQDFRGRKPQGKDEENSQVVWVSPQDIIIGSDWKSIVAVQRITYLVNTGRL